MKNFTKIWILAALIISASLTLNATIINVPADQATIQEGIDASTNGDTVLVQPGTYVENINFNGKNITVATLFLLTQDTAYISQTVIDGGQNGSVVKFENNETDESHLVGFTITNGSSSSGGGIYISNADPIVLSSTICANYSSNRGGGIFTENSSNPKFINLIINNNTSNQNGGGVYCGPYQNTETSIINCLIINNHAGSHGSAALLYCGTSQGNDFLFLNNTITKNTSNETHAAFFTQHTARIEVINSIIWENGVNQFDLNSNTTFTNCCTDYDPLFLSSEENQFSLQEASPCINEGILHEELPEMDLAINPRISQLWVDIGAYEYQLTNDFIYCEFGNEDYSIFQFGEQTTISWASNIDSVKIEFSADSIQWQTVVDSVFTTPEYLWTVPQVQTENAYIRLSKSSDNSVCDINDAPFSIYKTVIYGGDTISGNWTLDDTPVVILGEVILPKDSSLIIDPGVEVKLSTNLHGSIGGIRVRGDLNAVGTIQDSIRFTRLGNDGHWGNIVFWDYQTIYSSSNSLIKFVDIRYASSGYVGGSTRSGAVSWIYSFAQLSNSTISHCQDNALYLETQYMYPVIIKNCVFENKVLFRKHAKANLIACKIYSIVEGWENWLCVLDSCLVSNDLYPIVGNSADFKITNSQIFGHIDVELTDLWLYNNIIDANGHSYGVYHDYHSQGFIENNIISNASIDGIYCRASDATITNCVLMNNTNGLKVWYADSDVSVSNCIFWNNTTTFNDESFFFGMRNCLLNDTELPAFVADLGGNILNADPLFINSGDHPYQLSPGSPAINAGYVNSNLEQEIDLIGNTRVCKGRVDIGAYEYQQTGDWLWITLPTGDEYFETGTAYPITWNRSDSSSTVKIEFFDGNSWSVLENAAPNTGEYDTWIAPEMDADDCLFRVSDNGNGLSHTLEVPFHVKRNIIEHNEDVSGVWTIENSPYTVIGKANVPSGHTLTIEPGAEVKFKTGSVIYYDSEFFDIGMLNITGSGVLLAEGTADNPILFTRNGGDGLWGVIYSSSTSSSILRYCNIEYTNAYILYDIYFGGVSFHGSSGLVENCTFSSCFAGVVSAYSSSPTLVNNHFKFNYEGGVLCWKSPGTKIVNNEFYGNLGYGIRCFQSSPEISNNTITFAGTMPEQTLYHRNFPDTSKMLFKPENRNLLYGLYLDDDSNPAIQNSIVYANGLYEDGKNIHLEGGSAPTISHTLLSDTTLPAGAIDGGNNILGQNPFFKDPAKLDFSLSAASPGINTGNPDTSGMNLPQFDLAGNPRIYENGSIDMGAFEFQASVQKILLAQGWSGISTFISPEDDNVEQMFDPIINDLIILQNASGMFYPEENINTLDNWNVNEGYMIKVADTVELFISGTRESNLSLQLVAGWNLIPVLSECDVDIAELFNGTDLIIIKEVAGWGIFWPEFGINTLGALKSGKAYFVFMENEGEITFPECE